MKEKTNSMRNWYKELLSLVTLVVAMMLMPMKVAAQEIITGTMGDNGGLTWTYDADTKILTITGEDSVGESEKHEPLYDCRDAEKIVVQDCVLSDKTFYLFDENLDKVECIELINVDTSKVTDMKFMFDGLDGLKTLDISSLDTSNVTSMESMFEGCGSLTTLNISGLDTSKVTSMKYMFKSCTSLATLDVSDLDTGNVTNMNGMFDFCISLKSVDLSNFDTSNVKKMGYMFGYCESLTELDASKFNTANVKEMEGMFFGCLNLKKLDVSNFDTTNVSNMESLFYNCSNLKELDLSSFDMTKSMETQTKMSWMFHGCKLDVIHAPHKMAVGENVQLIPLEEKFYDETGNVVSLLTSESCGKTLKRLEEGDYIGNINSELISFDLKQNADGAYYLTGQIVVVEWVDGQSTVPKDAPTMIFKSTDGTEEIDVFVTPTGTNTYYFDRFIEGLSPDKEYVFEIASGTESNISPNRSMNVLLSTSPKMVPIKNLGKIGAQKISYYEADNGELRLYRQHSEYVGHINSELTKTELVKGPNGNYVSGQIVVVEWVNDVSTVPLETPIMYFKSTDNKEVLPVFITPTGTNTYYFDRSLGDMDTSKEYVFTIESGDEMNVSPYRSMIVTTAAMKNKTGTLWESDTQYVRYRTDANTAELRIYAVNK